MNVNSRSLLLAGVIAGAGIGILSKLPVIQCINCLLLAWVWLGGIAAVALYRNFEKTTYVNTQQGLIIGAVAGAIGAVIGAIVAAIFGGLNAAIMASINAATGGSTNVIPSFLVSTGFSFVGTIFDVITYAIFGAIGGLIATALIWKSPTTPPTVNPPTIPPSGPAAY